MGAPNDGDKSWFDEPRNVNIIVWTLVLACLGVMVGGEFIHKHGHFAVEYTVPGFYGLFGFVAYTCIIATAILLRKLVMRPEDYYDE
ncbi:MAG: hypothetical protein VYA30_03640 [Myxococcota bacterium]|nr:hypothetical protein [Myxococcota bacterium]